MNVRVEEITVPAPILTELVECLEEAGEWIDSEDTALGRRIDLALEDYRFFQAVTHG